MTTEKTPTGGILYKSALFGTGLLGVFLWRRDRLPKYVGMISIGAASIGLCSTLWHVLRGSDEKEQSNTDIDPLDSFYEQIASQVNEQLSQQDSSCKIREIRKHTVDENKEFDPIAYLRSGAKRTGVSDGRKEIPGKGSSLQNSAGDLKSKTHPESKTKPKECASNDNSEISIDEDDTPISEIEEQSKVEDKEHGKFVLNVNEMRLRMPEMLSLETEEQKLKKIELWKEWETVYPEVEKEISNFKWSEKGLKVRKILGIGRSKTGKK